MSQWLVRHPLVYGITIGLEFLGLGAVIVHFQHGNGDVGMGFFAVVSVLLAAVSALRASYRLRKEGTHSR